MYNYLFTVIIIQRNSNLLVECIIRKIVSGSRVPLYYHISGVDAILRLIFLLVFMLAI